MKTRLLTFAMLLLSLSVLNWGLQYKMSLYHHSADKVNAPAKLWTGSKDKPQAHPETLAVRVVQVVLFVVLFLVVRYQRSLAAFFYARRISRPWKRQPNRFQYWLFLLPPPSHL